jgi:hypothetical protein
MQPVLTSDDPGVERERLLGQAKHCRNLASAAEDDEAARMLASLARSYEAKASLVR